MNVGAVFFAPATGPGAGASGPLDAYTSGLWAACALKKLVSSYAGPCLRLRRSDNMEVDIGFTAGGDLDVATATTFVGAGDAFISAWYDQSGFGNHLFSSAAYQQPRIFSGGVYGGKITFNANGNSQQGLFSTNSGAVSPAKSIFRKVATTGQDSYNYEFSYGNSRSGRYNIAMVGRHPYGFTYVQMLAAAGGGSIAGYSEAGLQDGSAQGIVLTTGRNPGFSGVRMFKGAVENPQISSGTGASYDNGGSPNGNFEAFQWFICNDVNLATGAHCDLWSCVIYDTDKSTDAAAINAAIT